MLFGYHGFALVVDLTAQTATKQRLDQSVLRDFIGGTGLAAYLLYEHCPPGADPLGPDNPLIFTCSPLVGSRLTTSSKFAVAAKSPLTGMVGDSLSSSFLAVELKRTGFDALVIKGRSPHPTLLAIEDDEVEFLDASDLLGLNTFETEQAVKGRLGRRFRVACIGPGGRERRSICQHRQRRRQAGGTNRDRRGHGLEEPQGCCRPRTQPGSGLRPGPARCCRKRPVGQKSGTRDRQVPHHRHNGKSGRVR